MKYLIQITIAVASIVIGSGVAMAIEEAAYSVVMKDKKIEIRDYGPYILAETIVEGDMGGAGNTAFSRLFGYISGKNRSKSKMAMTAPVSQEAANQKIEMTSPVGQQRMAEGWAISFMMPASYTLDTLPEPEDPKIRLRQVPGRRMVALRYSGRWTEKAYLKHKTALEAWIQEKGLVIQGEPIWARYNAPFVPWFMRRNEVLIPIE